MKASYVQAGYQGPEQAPFQCGNCVHFDTSGACELVDGTIDSAACCNLFFKGQPQAAQAQAQQPNKVAALKAIQQRSQPQAPAGYGSP